MPWRREVAIHSIIIAWKIPWTEEPCRLHSIGLQRVGHSWATSLHFTSAFFMVQLSHPYTTTGKTIALTSWTFISKVMSLLFHMLSRLIIAFLPRSKHLLISWLQSPSAVILEPRKIKSVTVFISTCHEVIGPEAMIFDFWMLSFKPAFSVSSFTFTRGSLLFAFCQGWCHLHIWGYWYFSLHSWFQLVLHPAQHFALCTLHIN